MPGDQRAEDMVNDLLACVCGELEQAGRAVCCCMWRRADQLLMPQACSCECAGGQGVAWVRLVERRYGRESRGQAPQSRGFSGGFCGPAGLGEVWQMEAGVSRCWPEREEGLSCEEHSVLAADGAWDENLLMIGLACCESLSRYQIQMERIRTLGPEGGCIAAVAEFTARPAAPRPPHPSQVPDGELSRRVSSPKRL